VPLIAGLGDRAAAVLALAVTVPARRPVLAVLRGDRGPALIPVLVDTGRIQLLYGALLSVGLWVSS
jgi:1,4-dihydroxy-2-naphthoate octaprenyltransferase